MMLTGAQGGLGSLLILEKPIIESLHAKTALLGLVLLGIQSFVLAGNMDKPLVRTAHAWLGTATLAIFGMHMIDGLQLGLSF